MFESYEKYNGLTHILLYTNSSRESELANDYIISILKLGVLNISVSNIYYDALYSGKHKNMEDEIENFKSAKYGIISCVYMFGEGFDLPKLNGVCIACNMYSETRIVQYLLRPNRLENSNPVKKAFVIIPYIDTADFMDDSNSSYDKVRTVISQMRNVDEAIEQKMIVAVNIKVFGKKNYPKNKSPIVYEDYSLEENINELDKIKMRLRYSKALNTGVSEEQDEYNYVKLINKELGVQSKKEYMDAEIRHSHYIREPEEYFKSKGVWDSWYDFMGVDTKKFIQYKTEWINFCNKKKIMSLNEYYVACDEYDILPKEPADFYKEFTNIPTELGFNKNKRR